MSKFANNNTNNNNVYYNAIWHSFFWHFDTSSSVMSKFGQHYVKSFSKRYLIESKQYKMDKMKNYNDNLPCFCLSSLAKRIANQVKGRKRKFWATNTKGTWHREEGMKFALLSHDLFVTLTHIFFGVFLESFFFLFFSRPWQRAKNHLTCNYRFSRNAGEPWESRRGRGNGRVKE